MRPLVIVTFCCALLALGLTLAPVFTGPPENPTSADDRSARITALEGRVDALRDQLVETKAKLQRLRARDEGADFEEIEEIVDGVIRDAVREELRETMRRFWEERRRGGGGGDRRRGPPDAEDLAENLDLDGDKAELVADAFRELGEGIRDIWRENRGGSREENVRLMRELEGEVKARLAEELTEEELARVEKLYERMRDGGRNRRRDRPPPDGAEEF